MTWSPEREAQLRKLDGLDRHQRLRSVVPRSNKAALAYDAARGTP